MLSIYLNPLIPDEMLLWLTTRSSIFVHGLFGDRRKLWTKKLEGPPSLSADGYSGGRSVGWARRFFGPRTTQERAIVPSNPSQLDEDNVSAVERARRRTNLLAARSATTRVPQLPHPHLGIRC